MYISMSRLRVAPERADDLVTAFRNRMGLVDGFDGFEGLEVWRSDREPEVVAQ
jgi:heme-degrading monooxygenase HmoA